MARHSPEGEGFKGTSLVYHGQSLVVHQKNRPLLVLVFAGDGYFEGMSHYSKIRKHQSTIKYLSKVEDTKAQRS